MSGPDWEKASELIRGFEEFVPYPYDDAHYPPRRWTPGTPVVGTLTVGYGETDPDFVQAHIGGISEPEARARFDQRLVGFWEGVSRYLTTQLNPNQAAAVLSLAYNAGAAGMAKWAPALLEAINNRHFDEAAQLWRTSITNGGLPGLLRRRAAEAKLFMEPYHKTDEIWRAAVLSALV